MDPVTDEDRKVLARIFHADFYTRFYPDLGRKAADPLSHYLEFGLAENRRPHPLFNPEFYLRQNVDVRDSGASPILHYLRFGGSEWRAFSPFVDNDAYYGHYRQDVAQTGTGTALEDVVASDDRSRALQFLDIEHYRFEAPHLTFNRALEHFLTVGLANGTDPHPLIRLDSFIEAGSYAERFLKFESLFLPEDRPRYVPTHPIVDVDYYVDRYGKTGVHPVVHLLRFGQGRPGLTLHPLFDPDFYAGAHGLSGSAAAMTHYARVGIDRLAPNPYLDPVPYREAYAHTFEPDETVIAHYMRMGHLPWFEPGPNFAQRYYVRRYPDAAVPGRPALLHYLQYGQAHGFTARPSPPTVDLTRGLDDAALIARINEVRTAPRTPQVTVIVPVYGQLSYTLRCLLALVTTADTTPFEVLVVDDASPDGSGATLAEAFAGHALVRVMVNDRNLGFLRSCNAAAATSTAPFLFFLNNDTVVLDGWLDEIALTFAREAGAGLVGSRLVYPNGLLQEAGGIVWSDGSAANYGRMDDAFAPAYGFQRDVDYVSGAAIMLPRALWEDVGGFSEEFAPAYYEDTDLAMKVRAAGRRVIYQPLSTVVHYEGVSSGTDITKGVKRHQVVNGETFARKWAAALAGNGAPGDLAQADRGARARILLFDAEVPAPDRDSGSVTTYFYLKLLSELGYRVTLLSNVMQRRGRYATDLQRFGVEVQYAPYVTDPRAFILEHAAEYDLVILARAPNAGRLLPTLKARRPEVPVVFDTVDLHHLRMLRQADLADDETLRQKAWEMRDIELNAIRSADVTLLVSEAERDLVRHEIGPFPHVMLPLIYEPYEPRTPFADRNGVAFVGGFRHPPNVDAVEWLVRGVWPYVRAASGGALRLTVIGTDLPPSLAGLAAPDIEMVGYVKELEETLERMRLTVAPLRYGAGVKGKVGNSLRLGVPVVATPVASEGMGLVDGETVLIGRDEREIAAAIVRLHGDEALWTRMSADGRRFAEARFGLAAARRKLGDLARSLIKRLH